MTTEATPVVKAASWTEDEIKVIAMYQEKLGMTRYNAIRKMRTDQRTPPQQLADGPVAKAADPKPEPKAKTPRKPKAAKELKPKVCKGDAKHYDQQRVIDMFMSGKTIRECAEAQKPMS